jgi:hypothetical protein
MRLVLRFAVVAAITLGFSDTALAGQPQIDRTRAASKDGLNVFEPPRSELAPFDSVRIRFGGAFTQAFQMLDHTNSASPKLDANNVDLNKLVEIGSNFNTATANKTMDVQLARGVRTSLTLYLSARHHNETWVKGGYFQLDALPFLPFAWVDRVMQYTTIKVGHMEIDYGDMHFRRTDNGNSIHNPFVENLVLDAFATEIGGEVYLQHKGALALVGVTNGEIKGEVTSPKSKGPAVYLKTGYDRQVSAYLRVRLTGSVYHTGKAASNTLYSGDRAGSHYYFVMENALATSLSPQASGRLNPGFRNEVTAWVVNPFVKYRGLELFGNLERASGRATTEAKNRDVAQVAGEAVYRFGADESFYVGGRYNKVSGRLAGAAFTKDISIDRIQLAGGWFMTENVLGKVEYVDQSYTDFPASDIRNKGGFNGLMLEAVVAF